MSARISFCSLLIALGSASCATGFVAFLTLAGAAVVSFGAGAVAGAGFLAGATCFGTAGFGTAAFGAGAGTGAARLGAGRCSPTEARGGLPASAALLFVRS